MPDALLSRYRQLVARGAISPDPHQASAVDRLNRLSNDLTATGQRSLLKRISSARADKQRGIYLWGGVGRGKTWLMDLFFEQLAMEQKQRTHFHRFMQRLHQGLRATRQSRNPLSRIAARLAKDCRVLCLDEFFVSDITDAMLLGGLLDHLFRHGVTLVTTSNLPPGRLYEGGLQRQRFLPAIEMIENRLAVIELAGDLDYRLRILERSTLFHHPADQRAEAAMTAAFERIAANCELDHDLEINGRRFHARRRGDGVIWFEFSTLCDEPTGSIDFIEIARAFNTVMISNVPRLTDEHTDAARRFLLLIDEFYDRNVKLLMSAAAPAHELYDGRRMAFEFERTASRLAEMQSHDYLARPHLP